MNYLLSGSESFLLKKRLDEIMKEWIKDDPELSVVTYDASMHDFSMAAMIEDASTIPFFTANKMIVVKNCEFLSTTGSFSDADLKILEKYLENPSDTSVVVFMLEKDKLDSRKKIVKTLRKVCREFKCDPLQNDEFSSVLKQQIKVRKIELDKEAYQMLEERLANSLAQMDSELNKLALCERRLTKEDIELLVSRPLEDKAFDLVNAVIAGKMKQVFRIWRDLQVAKTDPILLTALIGRQFHLIYQVKLLSRAGKGESTMAQILSAHPYSIKLAHQNSRLISESLLKELISECAALDQKFKSGLVDRTLGFEHFLIHTAGRINACRH